MKPPRFWNQNPGSFSLAATVLAPLGALYAGATARRVASQKTAPENPVPVICVGNINAGGTGKTPTVIALCQMLAGAGQKPFVVSRGYGGNLGGPIEVDPTKHTAQDVGDEPILIAAFAPVWVARDRQAGIARAAKAGASIILMDDGFQTPSVNPDFSIVVADAHVGFGNGRVIPAGPLREPAKVGLARANALLTIGDETAQKRFDENWGHLSSKHHARGQLVPLQTGLSFSGLRLFAFAGIGRPEKFFETLRGLGAELAGSRALEDHQELSTALLTRMEREAKALNAQLVTTEKDAVRLPRDWQQKVMTVPVRLEVTHDGGLAAAITALFEAS